MNIIWHGLSCFEINTKTTNGEVTLITDPFDNNTGLRLSKTLAADLVAVSHNDSVANNFETIQNNPFIISIPGEYEIKGVFVYSINAPLVEKGFREHCIFRIEVEGMHLVHLGALNRSLTNEELSELGDVDILMLPVGGGRVLSPKLATEIIEQLEPRVVIPMTYAIDGLKESLGAVENFYKAVGVAQPEITNKLKISQRDLPEEDMRAVILERV